VTLPARALNPAVAGLADLLGTDPTEKNERVSLLGTAHLRYIGVPWRAKWQRSRPGARPQRQQEG
jgi:hypothetical protein